MVMKQVNKNKGFWVVAYDIADNRRRSRVIKIIQRYGVRANYSVFECMFTQKQLESVRERILKVISLSEDSVIFYPLCRDCYSKVIYPSDKYRKPQVVAVL